MINYEAQWFLMYQPIIELETSKPIKFEALIRWKHPDLGILMPKKFLGEILKDKDLEIRLNRFVIDTAKKQAAKFNENGIKRIAVNLSAGFLRNLDLVKYLGQCEELIIEIPEKCTDREVGHTLHRISKQTKAELSCDDFGTEAAYIARLTTYIKWNYLKLDRRYIPKSEKDVNRIAIIKSLVMLCESLEIKLIVEGIEKDWQVQKLTEAGVKLGQGFYLARPMKTEDAEQWLKNHLKTFTD